MAKTKDEVKPGAVDKVVEKFMEKVDKTSDKFEEKMNTVKPGAEDKVVDKFTDKMDKSVDKFVDKIENEEEPNMSEVQDAAYYEYGGEAVAMGEDTFTQVESTSKIVGNGPVTVAKINMKATAVGSDFANASTYVDSDSDISVLINFEQNTLEHEGVKYDISKAKFIGVYLPDHVNLPNGPLNKVIIIDRDEELDLDPALAGNIAGLSIEAEVVGDKTYLEVDAYALSTDTFSISDMNIIAEVA